MDQHRTPDPVEALWQQHRQRAIDVAYRMLGSVHDAEDVVQEAYLRLVAADVAAIDDVRGWLVTVTSRLAIDRLRAHEHRKRAYPGPWLPEPIVDRRVDPGGDDVADRVTLDESVRMALLVVLEELSPAERIVFVLHDVFALPFDEISSIVGRSPAACRQLASRARRRVAEHPEQRRFEADGPTHEQLVRRFAAACAGGDVDALLEILDPDVVGDFDSGGTIPGAPLAPLHGAGPVARQLLASLHRRGAHFDVFDVNGEPGVVVRIGVAVMAVITVAVRDGRIDVLHGVGNPDKLQHLRT